MVTCLLQKSMSAPLPRPDALRCAVFDLLNILWQDKKLDFQLLLRLAGGVEASRGFKRMSIALDKANVGVHQRSSVISLPNDIGISGAPQVGGASNGALLLDCGPEDSF